MSTKASKLQRVQNNMLTMVFGYELKDRVNMEKLREKIKMLSVNQMNSYHVLIEAFNIINFGSADQIQEKWLPKEDRIYSNRRKQDVKVPSVKHVKCRGFSWHAAKLWNSLPEHIKSIKKPKTFKARIKDFILETIPSY